MVDLPKIFDSVDAIWILTDLEGRVVLASKQMEKFEDVIHPRIRQGASVFESIPASWQGLSRNVLNGLLQPPFTSTLEVSYDSPEGKETHFEIRCAGIRDDQDAVSHIFIEAQDVTPQKIFEKKITLVAREYQSVIENANAVIIGTDARGYITEWNEMARQVTGFSKNDAYFQTVPKFLHSESTARYGDAMHRVLKGEMVVNRELILRGSDERKISLLTNATPRTSASGEVVGILLIGQDISELSDYRRSLEEKVRERTEALKKALENEKKLVEVKDRFVSMASHEFRSPISYIHRSIGAIKENIETLSAAEVRERLSKIQSQADHLSSLLEDVLTMGKTAADNPRITASLRMVELRDFFLRIIDEVRANTQQTHRIELDFPVESLQVQSDENLLRNIFVNLLTNAIKFSPGRDTVYVSVEPGEECVACSVRDEGLGIEEEDLARIFEPFHRGDNVKAIKGTGLGLPIVKRAVEALGGSVEVKSKPGQGTVFQVKLSLHHS